MVGSSISKFKNGKTAEPSSTVLEMVQCQEKQELT